MDPLQLHCWYKSGKSCTGLPGPKTGVGYGMHCWCQSCPPSGLNPPSAPPPLNYQHIMQLTLLADLQQLCVLLGKNIPPNSFFPLCVKWTLVELIRVFGLKIQENSLPSSILKMPSVLLRGYVVYLN